MYQVYDSDNNLLMYLQNVTSIQWKSKYCDTGSFEIHARPTEDNRAYLKKWNHIVCYDDYKLEIGFIFYVEHSKDGKEMIVRGYMDALSCIVNLTTHTIKRRESFNDLLADNNRFLYSFALDSASVHSTLANGFDTTFKTLYDTFLSYCSELGLGWKTYKNYDGTFSYRIYQGRRQESARFSDVYGNLLEQTLIEDMSSFKNIAYVYGEEKADGTRANVTVDMRNTGDPNLELFVDARDLQSTYRDANNVEQSYTEAEYNAMLTQRGFEKLLEARKAGTKFTFKIQPENSICKLGIDYVLGDIVPVISKRFGLSMWARITGIDYVEEAGKGTQISLTVDILQTEVIANDTNSISDEQ